MEPPISIVLDRCLTQQKLQLYRKYIWIVYYIFNKIQKCQLTVALRIVET